jgi:hypothetical protein
MTIADSATGTEWVAVDNVIVQVHVHFGQDPEDTQERVDAVEAALRSE